VQGFQAVRPERPEPEVEVRPAAVELVQVEEELDLDVALVRGQLAERTGQGLRVEGGRGLRGHVRTSEDDDPW